MKKLIALLLCCGVSFLMSCEQQKTAVDDKAKQNTGVDDAVPIAEVQALTKADLALRVAEIGLTEEQSVAVVEAVFETIKSALASGKSVALAGFGTFSLKKREARTGHNPRTGETIRIKAKSVPVFGANRELKDAVSKH